jgi:hypothetical protein
MKRQTLKQKLFRAFEKDLATAGATKGNTKVKRITSPKAWGAQILLYLENSEEGLSLLFQKLRERPSLF